MSISSKWTVVGAVLCVAGCATEAAGTPGEHADEHSQTQAATSAGAAAAKPPANATGMAGAAAAMSQAKPAQSASPSAGSGAVMRPTQAASAGSDGASPMGMASAGAPAAASSSAAAGSGGAGGGMSAAAAGGGAPEAPVTMEKFSFFVTSLQGMRELSKSENGFGGDLRYGESTGLKGADKICTELAEKSMPGAGGKGWRAFLSAAKASESGGPVHAKDRIGMGPWYDRTGRLVAMNLANLLNERPMGADPAIIDDLPNERGEPNHTDTMPDMDDNHDVVTATNASGMWDGKMTCQDWTSTDTPPPPPPDPNAPPPMGPWGNIADDGPGLGHSWPSEFSGASWMTAHRAPGCSPSVALVQMGAGMGTGIGNAGGYGGIYCFALKP